MIAVAFKLLTAALYIAAGVVLWRIVPKLLRVSDKAMKRGFAAYFADFAVAFALVPLLAFIALMFAQIGVITTQSITIALYLMLAASMVVYEILCVFVRRAIVRHMKGERLSAANAAAFGSGDVIASFLASAVVSVFSAVEMIAGISEAKLSFSLISVVEWASSIAGMVIIVFSAFLIFRAADGSNIALIFDICLQIAFVACAIVLAVIVLLFDAELNAVIVISDITRIIAAIPMFIYIKNQLRKGRIKKYAQIEEE